MESWLRWFLYSLLTLRCCCYCYFFLIQNSVTFHHIGYSSCLDTCVLRDHYSSEASTWSKLKSLLQSRMLLACSSVHVQVCVCVGGESNVILWQLWWRQRNEFRESWHRKKQEQKQKTQTIGIFRGDGLQPIYLLKTQHIIPHLAENTFSFSVINTQGSFHFGSQPPVSSTHICFHIKVLKISMISIPFFKEIPHIARH